MLVRKKLNSSKPAEISIEVSLSVIMCIVILLLVLGLFGNNIHNIAEASGLQNLFKRENSIAKTFQDERYSKNDPTATQVNVQLVADQGLDYYINNALATIEKYKQNPPAKDDEQSIEELAKAATIAKLAGKLDDGYKVELYKVYGININTTLDSSCIKIVKNDCVKILSFNNEGLDLRVSSDLLTLIKNTISTKFQSV